VNPPEAFPHHSILVVDDDADIRTSVADILRGQGYDVREAGDGEEALEAVGTESFDAIVLDVRMPKVSGTAVLDALPDPPPVVLMSAHALASDDRCRVQDKVCSYLRKPFPPRVLIDELAGIVGAGGRP
jgi:CheY-like chemotaxis protein